MVYHWVKGGMPMRGIELVTATAEQAEANQQIDQAIELYTHAIEIFPHDESLRLKLERLENAP